ncbi:MAG: multifunctional oxoglutarate decarboxylase/oxoglutarate dehydrogenase thiamine pyrophosphate-binding subunit/dihydrolipoyllysine-residue succinyltransferase subunit [Myxococcota bacterium]
MTNSHSGFGLNQSYVEALRAQWLQDPASVSDEWRDYFEERGAVAASVSRAEPAARLREVPTTEVRPQLVATAAAAPAPVVDAHVLRAAYGEPAASDKIQPLFGIAARIAENMEASLGLPTATSTRTIPMKVLEENRRVVNRHLADDARPRASFTHFIAWALVRALDEVPAMNNGFSLQNGKPVKLVRADVNLGLAIDLPGRDGARTLVVPNLKRAQQYDFKTFLEAYNDLIDRARGGKLSPEDFEGTTLTLTNPGGLGTVSSNPRLMPGQGTIIATGAIGYPAEYEATSPETLRALGIGKVLTMTSTYDHRVIQGAESGRFLARVHELLNGEHGFYDELFQALGIPHHPHRLEVDRAAISGSKAGADVDRAMKVSQLIHAFRVRGHVLANVDPLDLKPRAHPELNLGSYGLTIWDLDREFSTLGVLPRPSASFRDIVDRLRDTYCRRMGIEYMYIPDPEEKAWIQRRVEQEPAPLSREDKRRILRKLSEAQGFERFLHKRYMGHKRFSVEGAESVIAMLDECLSRAAAAGATDLVIGMAHRGRLNVLANIMGKSYEAIFAEFEDVDPQTFQGSGDVKYHLGARGSYHWRGETSDGGSIEERMLRVELACNPSHLEAVNPVVIGQCRARQDMSGDRQREKIIPVLLHGDAAFAGQGVVYETLQMSNLQGYRVGGTIHIIINNQIGYTTGPERARTAPNASDVARAVMSPVFRVNGDDPEACLRAVQIAFEYRQRFHRDVVIDMVCYRRHGHNEGDEPSFTQPILYDAIRNHEPTRDRYAALLVRRGDLTEEEVAAIEAKVNDRLEAAFSAIQERGVKAVPERGPHRPGEYDPDAEDEPDTRVPLDTLRRITDRITYDPDVIELHPRVKKQVLDRRRDMVFAGRETGGPGVDFGMAENLAYGSLLLEGIPVRMSGQDVGRGTFAHRHAILYDVKDGTPYIPLNYLAKNRDEGEEEWHPSRFRIYDSLLSEEAVLGFEYGYSVTHPDSLVLWEAQFGDFVNGAQIQIDQFISAGESKWLQKSRVSLMLPHGYDGQGPEHSSARLERFLQLCAADNMRVCIASTPAQHFHLLRRQAKQPKKPLVLFTHKSLLRAEDAASSVTELAEGSFRVLLDDPAIPAERKVRRVVLCSGKVYWDLERYRQKARAEGVGGLDEVCLVRVEQLYPFPAKDVADLLLRRAPERIVWVQEEPRNMGAWDFIVPRMLHLGVDIHYVGRRNSASPATGSKRRHDAEQQALIEAAFSGEHDSRPGHWA